MEFVVKVESQKKKNPYHNCSHLHKWSMVGQFALKGVAIFLADVKLTVAPGV